MRQARAEYCHATGISIAPACVQNLARPWQRASLDGLSADGELALGLAPYAIPAEFIPK